jgi:serine/threonine-protein kinase RsbW
MAMGAGDSRAGHVGLARTYAAVPESVAAIRAALAGLACAWGVPPRIVRAVLLAASEAATNVVLHAYRDSPDPGHIEVIGTLAAGELVVTVRDSGSGLRPRGDSPGLGLGLAVIAQQADRLDMRESPAGGVEMRMYFVLPPPLPG